MERDKQLRIMTSLDSWKKNYKNDQLRNYIILLTNHTLLFTVSTDMKKTFIKTSCDLFDLNITQLDLLDIDHSNLGLEG